MRTLSLFSGIGGLDLGLERAGFKIVAMVEREPYPQAVLRERFPGVEIFDDVRKVNREAVRHLGRIDAIVGGFPCQDISAAGRGDGIEGERSGLWFEMLRLIEEIGPVAVIAENVPALRTRGSDIVLAGLEGAGYSAGAVVVGARDVGAPHRRDRVFICGFRETEGALADADLGGRARDKRRDVLDSKRAALGDDADGSCGKGHSGAGLADAEPARLQGQRADPGQPQIAEPGGGRSHRWPASPGQAQYDWEPPRISETAKSEVGGGPDGLPIRVLSRIRRERLRALGNAVVPQVGEVIGRAVLAAIKLMEDAADEPHEAGPSSVSPEG